MVVKGGRTASRSPIKMYSHPQLLHTKSCAGGLFIYGGSGRCATLFLLLCARVLRSGTNLKIFEVLTFQICVFVSSPQLKRKNSPATSIFRNSAPVVVSNMWTAITCLSSDKVNCQAVSGFSYL